MKKNTIWMISLISIIVFNIFFIVMLTYYNDIIIVTNQFFKSITKEYWYWYLDRPSINNEVIIIGITKILKAIFSLIFTIEFLYIVSNYKYINIIGKRKVVISLIVGFIIYCLSFLFIKYKAEHYRLFMTLISTELLSLVVLNLLLTLKKEGIKNFARI